MKKKILITFAFYALFLIGSIFLGAKALPSFITPGIPIDEWVKWGAITYFGASFVTFLLFIIEDPETKNKS